MRKDKARSGYFFIAPAILVFLTLSVYPILYEIYLSFTDWYLLRNIEPVWNGIGNYTRLFHDQLLWSALRRTAVWTIGTVILEYICALPFALLLNRRNKVNGILSGIILLPWVTPTIVTAYTWNWLLDGQYGAIHYLLKTIGLVGDRSLLVDPSLALIGVILVSAWKGVPFMTIALLAGLKGIPDELNEAAAVDGATRWQQFRYITFPLLRSVSVVITLVLGILAFYSFDIVWIMTQGGPSNSTLIIGVYLFRQFFERNELSYAATIGIVMLVILLIFSTVYLRGTRKTNN